MTEETTPSTEYPYLIDTTRLPITHNHLIGPIQGVSLDNIRGTLALLRRLVRQADGHDLHLSGDEVHGLKCVLENVVQALRFEQYHRANRE